MRQVSESSVRDIWHSIVSHSPAPGERYRHYKGHVYEIVGPCIDEDSMAPSIIYRDPASGVCWVRTLTNFTDAVLIGDGKTRLRFERVANESH